MHVTSEIDRKRSIFNLMITGINILLCYTTGILNHAIRLYLFIVRLYSTTECLNDRDADRF